MGAIQYAAEHSYQQKVLHFQKHGVSQKAVIANKRIIKTDQGSKDEYVIDFRLLEGIHNAKKYSEYVSFEDYEGFRTGENIIVLMDGDDHFIKDISGFHTDIETGVFFGMAATSGIITLILIFLFKKVITSSSWLSYLLIEDVTEITLILRH